MSETDKKTEEVPKNEVSEQTLVDMPEGCRCSLKWRRPDDTEGFTWYYLTICPVKLQDHGDLVYRPMFGEIFNSGAGGGQAFGGARIIIDDGKVSSFCFFWGVGGSYPRVVRLTFYSGGMRRTSEHHSMLSTKSQGAMI